MKTSNIILAAVAGSITILLVTGILQNRFFGPVYAEGQQDYNLESSAIDLPAFKYLVIRNEANVEILSPGKNQLILRYDKGEAIPVNAYHVSGDTLYVGNPDDSVRNNAYTQLSIPPMDYARIQGINSHFRFTDFYSQRMALALDNAEADLSDAHGQDLKTLDMHGLNGSQINSGEFHVDSLSLWLDDTKANMGGVKTGNLSGSIKNHSELNIKDVSHFDFTRDESSKLSHWN